MSTDNTTELNAEALSKDIEWFAQGMASKFGVPASSIEVRVTVYDDLKGERVAVARSAAG